MLICAFATKDVRVVFLNSEYIDGPYVTAVHVYKFYCFSISHSLGIFPHCIFKRVV